MALNVPSGDKKNLSFGPGILLVTTALLATPNVDIGYVQGAQFQYQSQDLKVYQGSPKTLVARFGLQTDATLQVTGIEWNLFNIQQVIGGTLKGGGTILPLGGSAQFPTLALLYRHRTPNQGTVEIRMWQVNGSGNFQVNFDDNLQTFPFNWDALIATQQFDGTALASDGSEAFGHLVYIKGA